MQVYIYPIVTALMIFPVLAVVFTLPYVIAQYHKYGALLIIRIILVYSFIFYMMTSFFMTVLPLPPIDSVSDGDTSMLLTPFDALHRWWNTSGVVLSNPSTYIGAFNNYEFFQIIFNILLLVPFGVYLRYYFCRKWYHVLILSFMYSLFFELTQLSGLYGIYPHPYRWFEVDDLICNTLGGMAGFWMTPMCSFFLPSRERLDEMSYRKGKRISTCRRCIAVAIDYIVIIAIYEALDNYIHYNTELLLLNLSIISFIYFTFSSIVTKGRSIGKAIVSFKICNNDGENAKWYQCIIRYALLYLIIIPIPQVFLSMLQSVITLDNIIVKVLYLVLMIGLAILFICFIINVFIQTITRKQIFQYEKISKTKVTSTVELDK